MSNDNPQMNGNAAALRKALKEIDRVVFDKWRHTKEEIEAHRLATEALTVPPRNCDVGTPEEQMQRHEVYCLLSALPCNYSCRMCFARWAQIPYRDKPTTTNNKQEDSK